jgi:tRNA modification GTPase
MSNPGIPPQQEIIVALATPPGVGAIGVIRLSGQGAIELVQSVFKGKDLRLQPGHTAHFGRIHQEQGYLLDEVLVTIFRAPRSYTREDTAEISCHGSPYIIQELIQLFIRRGARLAKPGEYTLRAFLNGQLDLSQAEAVADLIAADSKAAHDLAMNQMRGGFSNDIKALRQELIDFAALIELELDFGEEDVEFADRERLRQLILRIQAMLHKLILSFALGNVLRNGVSTVLAGRPNAGKSTLLNALLNEERAIVSDIAGTTRDTVEEQLNIQGVPFRLIDTAGIREAQDQIEAVGVRKTMEKIQQSALLLYIFDVIKTSPDEVWSDLQKLARPGLHLLVVANKMDLNPYASVEHYLRPEAGELINRSNFIPVAAIHQMNIEHLKDTLFQLVVGGQVEAQSTVVSNARHYAALQQAHDALGRALEGLQTGISGDFLAMDIRASLRHLGEITGEISSDDLLESIFSRFCIGK